MSRHSIFLDIQTRMTRNQRRYNNDNTEFGNGSNTVWLMPFTDLPADIVERKLRQDYEEYEEGAPVTWVHILREEMAEAFMTDDLESLRDELLDVAAVAGLCIEQIDRRKALQSG